MTKITYLIPKPSSEGGMTAITKMLYEIEYFDGVNYFHFNTSYQSPNRIGRLYEFFFRFFSFIKHLYGEKPDAIFVMSNSYLGFYEKCIYCLIARMFGVKSMLNHVGGEFDKFYRHSMLSRILIRTTIKFPNALLIGSSYWSNYFQNLFPKARVYSVPNPIIASAFRNGNSKSEPQKFVVTSLFRLVKPKGVYELIAVIKAVCAKYGHIEFVIIGGGPMLEEIKQELAMFIQEGKVRVLGFVDDATKVKEICRSDAYLMLTHFDLMPISIMEAMAAGKPILSTRVGGIPDLVEDNINGFLFNIGETTPVVEKLSTLIDDPEKGRLMGKLGSEKVDMHFDISRITALHQQIADELCA